MKNKIISIQSHLAYGYVGNNVAKLAIQLHGLDAISLPTVLLAAHSGHQPMYGTIISKSLFDDLVTGVKVIGLLETTAGIVSGYIKTSEVIDSVSDFVCEIKKEFPDRFYICDPVMGDVNTGLYIPEDTAQKIISKFIPICDILTPNHFELEYILSGKFSTIEELTIAVRGSTLLKSKVLIVTSCNLTDTPNGMIETVVVTAKEVKRIASTKVEVDTVGTGDIFAAILASLIAKGYQPVDAVSISSKHISTILSYMHKRGYDEMNAECLLNSGLINSIKG